MIGPTMEIFERVKSYDTTGRGASGTSCSLRGRCFADAPEFEYRQTGPRRIARDTCQPAVDHCRHAFDGDGAFGDIGGKNHLALRGRGDSPILLGGWQIAMQWKKQQIVTGCQRFTLARSTADLGRARQKNQNAASMFFRKQAPDR